MGAFGRGGFGYKSLRLTLTLSAGRFLVSAFRDGRGAAESLSLERCGNRTTKVMRERKVAD
ncbi:hypothetical protein J3R74_001534 [Puniceicoccus vermicola]